MIRFKTFLVLISFLMPAAFAARAQRAPRETVVKTGIKVQYKARLAVSNQLIAFGTGPVKGVDYIRPGDKAGRGIPGGEEFSSGFFAVCGEKIVLANPQDFTLSVFDAASGKTVNIPESTLRLRSLGGSMYYAGGIMSDGNFVAVITDQNSGDKSAFAVVDVSGAEPKVRGFPRFNNNYLKQVAVDSAGGRLVAATDNHVAVYDLKSAGGEPKVIEVGEHGGVGMSQMRLDGDWLLYHDNQSYASAVLLNVKTGAAKKLTRGQYGLALRGGTFCYFAARDAKDANSTEARAVVGKVGGEQNIYAADKPVDGATKNNGLHGFASSAAVTPDGKQIFMAGQDSIGRAERLNVHDGQTVRLVPDASASPAFLLASDVVASSTLVAFKTGANNDTTLAYIRLR